MNKKTSIFLYIFIIGLVNAIYQLGLIKQLYVGGKPFPLLSLTINSVVSLTIVLLGIGTYLSKFLKRDRLKAWVGGVGLSVMIVLFFLLLFSPEELVFSSSLALNFLVISVPMILMGICIGLIYRFFVPQKEVGKVVFFHILGFGIGQVVSIFFIRFIGANTLFFLIPLFCGLALIEHNPSRFFGIGLLIALVTLFPLEDKLEGLRNKEITLWSGASRPEQVYSGWSPYAKIDFYRFDDGRCLAGLYNYNQQWMSCRDPTKDFKVRKLLYPEFGGKVLLIGTGGGMSLANLNNETDVTAVEIDPLVVKLMKADFKEYNSGAYNQNKTIAADGRAFLESGDEKYDYIVFEGVDYSCPSEFRTLTRIDNHLYTKEGIKTTLDSLREGGVAFFFFGGDKRLVSRALASIPEDYSFLVREFLLSSPLRFRGHLLTVTKDETQKFFLASFFEKHASYFPQTDVSPSKPITDNSPFLYLPENMNLLLPFKILVGIGVVVIGLCWWCGKPFLSYFFILGSSMIMGELFYINIFRSLFFDHVTTFVVVSTIFFSGFSLGTYFHDGLKKYISITPLLMLVSLLMCRYIPWFSDLWVKIVFTLTSVFPPALLMGSYFPSALSILQEKNFPLAYLFDSLGGVIGFFLFYLLSVMSGLSFVFKTTIIMYFILILIFKMLK